MIITHLKSVKLKVVKIFALPAKDLQFYSYRNFLTTRLVSNNSETAKKLEETTKSNSIIESYIQSDVSTNLRPAQKVKKAAVDISYTLVFLAGTIAVIAIGYYLLSELNSRETPTGIYNESSKMCLENFTLQDALGEPITVSADSGGRRVFNIRHKIYTEDDGVYMIVQYFLVGRRNKATIHVKVKQSKETNKFEYEYIVAELEYPHRGSRKIIVQKKDDQPSSNKHF